MPFLKKILHPKASKSENARKNLVDRMVKYEDLMSGLFFDDEAWGKTHYWQKEESYEKAKDLGLFCIQYADGANLIKPVCFSLQFNDCGLEPTILIDNFEDNDRDAKLYFYDYLQPQDLDMIACMFARAWYIANFKDTTGQESGEEIRAKVESWCREFESDVQDAIRKIRREISVADYKPYITSGDYFASELTRMAQERFGISPNVSPAVVGELIQFILSFICKKGTVGLSPAAGAKVARANYMDITERSGVPGCLLGGIENFFYEPEERKKLLVQWGLYPEPK